jgi:hypothetical protein
LIAFAFECLSIADHWQQRQIAARATGSRVSTEAGIQIDESDEDQQKATETGNGRVARALHPKKRREPRLFTHDGMQIDDSFLMKGRNTG